MRDKLLYRGNGDHKDKLDIFVAEYMLRNRLYIEVTFVSHGLYIIGRGFSVKAQQAKTRLLVSDGPSHLSNSFVSVERHIETQCPSEWARIMSVKTTMPHVSPKPSITPKASVMPRRTPV